MTYEQITAFAIAAVGDLLLSSGWAEHRNVPIGLLPWTVACYHH
jgi:hypothetical protein